jgi:hypothetical protein
VNKVDIYLDWLEDLRVLHCDWVEEHKQQENYLFYKLESLWYSMDEEELTELDKKLDDFVDTKIKIDNLESKDLKARRDFRYYPCFR